MVVEVLTLQLFVINRQFVFSVMHRMSALVGFITTPSDGKDEILRHTFEEFQR